MQKLFSMFPAGAPGVALLLLRLFLSATLLAHVVAPAIPLTLAAAGLYLACALALVVGAVTPIAAIVVGLIGTFSQGVASAAAMQAFAPLVIGVALALLGPGAYSVDARLFGRRLMEFGPEEPDKREIDR